MVKNQSIVPYTPYHFLSFHIQIYRLEKFELFHSSLLLAVRVNCQHRFLDNIEEIMVRYLPDQNMINFFKNRDVVETYLLNQITFCEEMIQVTFVPLKVRVISWSLRYNNTQI